MIGRGSSSGTRYPLNVDVFQYFSDCGRIKLGWNVHVQLCTFGVALESGNDFEES